MRHLAVPVILIAVSCEAFAEPRAVETTVIGPWVGIQAPLHPDNLSPHRIRYYGTDLGFTYEHDGYLQILFGDTSATPEGDPIEAESGDRLEDSFGTVDLARWNDPRSFTRANMPLVRLGQNPGSAEAAALDPGHAMEGFKTPVGGFSNGTDEYGVFFTYKPQGCESDDDCQNGAQCDLELGYFGPPYTDDAGITWSCIEGQTSKFMNPSFRTVQAYVPPGQAAEGFVPDFTPASGRSADARIFVWGRPHFVGVNATGRTLGTYFAYVDLPSGDAIEWRPQYFSGLDGSSNPLFSPDEEDAVPLDQDSTTPGVQAASQYDIVDQVSVAWIPQLSRWLMFYGGGMISRPLEPLLRNCGVLEIFTGPECKQVVIGNGAFRMRSSPHPWGPWKPPQDLIAAGDPAVPKEQYGPGGMLRHPACTKPDCAPTTARSEERKDEYGFFYSANIIEQWTCEAGDGVDIIWNGSTWDPYRVILLRTRIEP